MKLLWIPIGVLFPLASYLAALGYAEVLGNGRGLTVEWAVICAVASGRSFDMGSTGGAHTYAVWQRYLNEVAPMLFPE